MLEPPGNRGPPDCKAIRANQASMAHRVNLVAQDFRAYRAGRGNRERLDLRGPRAPMET
jgi:hypothetical protein